MFSKRLKELRQDQHLTQTELAEKLHISRSSIGMYENGVREPDYKTLERIADFFNVDVNYLLGLSDMTTSIMTTAEISELVTICNELDDVSVKMVIAYAEGLRDSRKAL